MTEYFLLGGLAAMNFLIAAMVWLNGRQIDEIESIVKNEQTAEEKE